MANAFERYLHDDTVSAFFPSEAFPVIPALDADERPFAATHYKQITDLAITVPAANGTTGVCQVAIPYVCFFDPTNADYFSVNTNTLGSGTAFTVKVGDVNMTDYDVRVYPGLNWIDFHPSRAGETVYLTMRAGHTVWDATFKRMVAAELNAVSAAVISMVTAGTQARIERTFTAGILIPTARFVYLDHTQKMFLADPGDIGTHPYGFCPDSINLNAEGDLVVYGFVDGAFSGLQHGQHIYALPSGEWTQDLGDIDTNDYVVRVGRAIGTTGALIDCANPHFIKKASL